MVGKSEPACEEAFQGDDGPKLATFLASPHAQVRRAAAIASRCVARSARVVKSFLLRSGVFVALGKLLLDEDSDVKREAVSAFANFCAHSELCPFQV